MGRKFLPQFTLHLKSFLNVLCAVCLCSVSINNVLLYVCKHKLVYLSLPYNVMQINFFSQHTDKSCFYHIYRHYLTRLKRGRNIKLIFLSTLVNFI